eukprot:GHVR01135477.1.p1 GENE.GHVR01135477.1~~GHVR01135477.1.p1  ORF type:complete len:264 (-),score=44.03 GHVR01135477.1:419-1210(-)
MRTALIDADIAAYKAAARAEDNLERDYGFGGCSLDEQRCRDLCDQYVQEWASACKADNIIVCLSDPDDNWRKKLSARHPEMRQYKAHRPSDDLKPKLLPLAKNWLAHNYMSFIRPRLEADDILGILQTAGDKFVKGETVIVSEDKDLRTIPGLLYAPHRHELGVIDISPLDADRFHMYQTVVGDPTDNFFGAKGAGPKAAEHIVHEDRAHLWDAVLFEFQSRGMSEDDALYNARMAHILRSTEYNHTTKKLRLWSPIMLVRPD